MQLFARYNGLILKQRSQVKFNNTEIFGIWSFIYISNWHQVKISPHSQDIMVLPQYKGHRSSLTTLKYSGYGLSYTLVIDCMSIHEAVFKIFKFEYVAI